MKPITLDEDNWYVKLYAFLNHSSRERALRELQWTVQDSCDLKRGMFKSILAAAFLSMCFAVVVLLFGTALFLGAKAAWLMAFANGPFKGIILVAVLVLLIILLILLGYTGHLERIANWFSVRAQAKREKRKDAEPSFTAKMYGSWKNKYCVPVEFKREN